VEIAEMITKRLTMKDPIEVLFMKRSMDQQRISTGSNYSWKLGNFNSSVSFVAFKTKAAASQQTNSALFTDPDGANEITSLRIQLIKMYYPIDGKKLEFSNYDITKSYLAYITVQGVSDLPADFYAT
jgi:hypothetical protein